MWKKFLLLFVILILAVIGGLTIYLNNIDWNRHKDAISEQFSQATGKEVVFEGAVRFNLFPSPYLEASNISIYNLTAAGKRTLLAKIPRLVSTLSIRSLISGHFNVEKMNIVEPEIFVELYPDGRLNWQSVNGDQKDFRIDNLEISLNSVVLEKAKMHLINQPYNINSILDNMNAEIIAQSLFGPYRIEGSYIKNGNPGGFAISLGQFSESFATSANVVVSHPQSESYVRFDGTLLLNNDAINGNLIFESKNPVNFFNANFKNLNIPETYEHPLALSLEIKTDKNQISLANIVIKYGNSAGAGNILIPRQKDKIGENVEDRRKIDAAFNMTELEIEPIVSFIRDFLSQYDRQENYFPEYDFDVIADLKALKSTYNGEVVRDFDLSVDFINNVLKIQNLSATMPGNTSAKLTGEIFSLEKKLTYAFNLVSNTNDFNKLAQWLKINLHPASQSVYKKAGLSAMIEGNTEIIKISPFDLIVDKSVINGKLGVVRGDVNQFFLITHADSINFDNYLLPLPVDVNKQSWREKLLYQFNKLAFLKDINIEYNASLNMGIYDNKPFENLQMNASVKNGVMNIQELSLQSLASGDFFFKGELSGFSQKPQVKNLQYQVEIANVPSFLEKFSINIKDVDLQELNHFSSSGVVTGSLDRFATKSFVKLGNIDVGYHGQLTWFNNAYSLNGQIEIKTPDFVRMLNDFSIDYSPNYPLGLFKMSADVRTNNKLMVFNQLDANIGVNNFKGNLIYQQKDGRRQIKSNLKINRFELEKFFYNVNAKDENNNFRNSSDSVTFLVRPRLSQMLINYDWLQNWDANITFSVDNLSLNRLDFKHATGKLLLNNGILTFDDFATEVSGGKLTGKTILDLTQNKLLNGRINIKNLNINKNAWSGNVYGLTQGVLDADASFTTSAVSIESLLNNFSGNINFTINDAIVKGWNFESIKNDLATRDVADGFENMVRNALSQGETLFDEISGAIKLDKGVYVFADTLFANNDMIINMSGTGDLKNWTNNSSLQVVFNQSKVPGFDFSYEGSLNTPLLEVDVSKTTNVFNTYWAKKEAEAQALEQERIEKYRTLMQQQQNKAQSLENILVDEIIPDYETYSRLAEDKKIRSQYKTIGDRISSVQAVLQEILVKENMVNVSDEVITRLTEQNKNVEEQIKQIKEEITRVHLKDVKLRVANHYKRIIENYDNAKKISLNYVDKTGEWQKRLMAINTTYLLGQDKKVKEQQKQIDQDLYQIDEMQSEIVRDNIILQNTNDIEQLEDFAEKFQQIEQQTSDILASMEKTAADMLIYVEDKITHEEAAYIKMLQEQKDKQMMQENTGQISTAGGKTMTVGRDLEDIQKAEEAVKNKKIRVLDFSITTENNQISAKEQKNNEIVVK